MREHLFRGKRVGNGEWVEGLPFGRIGGGSRPQGINSIRADKDGCVYCVIAETVGEYTGLTDKNGKHIFEGDIVKVITPDHAIGFAIIGIGEIDGDGYKFIGVYGEIKGERGEMVARAEECYEVIGNIHDNPELLK